MVMLAGCVASYGNSGAAAEKVHLSKTLAADELGCLNELLHQHYVRYPPADEIAQLIAKTRVGTVDLTGDGRREFIYLIEDFGYCGTAGCWLLIGERRRDRIYHIIASANGGGAEVTVLRRRDHGYRRLYAPCELYFDGRQYQQVREECPNVDVRR